MLKDQEQKAKPFFCLIGCAYGEGGGLPQGWTNIPTKQQERVQKDSLLKHTQRLNSVNKNQTVKAKTI